MKKLLQYSYKTLILSTLLLTFPATYGAHILFDVGGIIIETKISTLLKEIGPKKLFKYIFRFNNPFTIRKKLFKVLHNIDPSENISGATDDKGEPLPKIMCDWLAGTKTCDAIITEINSLAEKNPKAFGSNHAEQDLIIAMINTLFSPDSIARSAKLLKETVKFIEECKAQGHTIYILSNFDSDSFNKIRKKNTEFEELFNLFDEDKIIVSGDEKIRLIKPDPRIYQKVLETHKLSGYQCIFFDDQTVNIDAAKALNINAVHCSKKPTYAFMRKELDKFLLLNQVREQTLKTASLES